MAVMLDDGTVTSIEEIVAKKCKESPEFKIAWENRPPRGKVTKRQKRTRIRLVKGDKF